jgi:phosphomethylpyrimidine synthase
MIAVPEDLELTANRLSAEVTEPFPASRKIYVSGSRPDIRVPMREIAQQDTPAMFGAEPNPPITVYDNSGLYTDPQARIDLSGGLPPLREGWIRERGDSEELDGPSSAFGRARLDDDKTRKLRFRGLRKPRRAVNVANVTQMHYARRGIVTPEMEFVAIRENLRREEVRDKTLLKQHPGQAFGARLPESVTPEFVRDEVARGRAIIP